MPRPGLCSTRNNEPQTDYRSYETTPLSQASGFSIIQEIGRNAFDDPRYDKTKIGRGGEGLHHATLRGQRAAIFE